MRRIETHDTRIVYGFHCSWWGGIEEVGPHHSGTPGLPGCPKCGNGLMEISSPESWWSMVDNFEKAGHPGYREFISWLRGKCFVGGDSRGFAEALRVYNQKPGRQRVVL